MILLVKISAGPKNKYANLWDQQLTKPIADPQNLENWKYSQNSFIPSVIKTHKKITE